LNLGGTIVIPTGVYIVDHLIVSVQGTVIQGSSGLASVLKLKNGADDHVIEFATSNFQAHNFKVDGNRSNNTSGGGIYINNCYWNQFSNVDVREASGIAWQLINSNSNMFNNCVVHDSDSNGWYLDADSQYNTLTGCGSEDVGGDIGIDCNGIGTTFIGTWVEWRSGSVTTSKVGYDINGRDNVIVSAVAKSAVPGTPLAVGIKLGASSYNSLILSANCGDCTLEVELKGTNQFRSIHGNIAVTNTDSDVTSSIYNGSYLGGLRFAPGVNNLMSLGVAGLRWSEVYASNGVINTSDKRSKQDISSIDSAEAAVAQSLKGLIKKFKFKDAVELKGDDARIHIGVIAQDVVAAFEAQGLDAHRYGILCYDEWDDEFDPDQNKIVTAGNIYGVRYDQLLAFIISTL
jgi:hypothetical protein